MIVIPEYALKTLMTQIVGATHGLTNAAGEPVITNTIPEATLRMAAVIAVQVAAGDAVWPGDKRLIIEQPKQNQHVLVEIDRR